MYSIFAPLDPNEPLPRELLHEAPRFRLFGGRVPLNENAAGRKELAGLLWLPALGLVLLLSAWANEGALRTVAAVALLALGLWRFARSGERKSR
jgi:low temperature requirement protein LtrA